MADTIDVCADIKDTSGSKSIGERLSVLETLSATSAQAMKSNENALEKVVRVIEKLDDKVEASARPQWNTLASWAGVIIVFIGMVGGSVLSSVISNQTRIETALMLHSQNYQEYVYKTSGIDGRQTEKLNNVEGVIERLREQQKRETSYLDAELRRQWDTNNNQHIQMTRQIKEDVAEASDVLDTRLQRELNDRVDPLSQRIDAIEQRAAQRANMLETKLYDYLCEVKKQNAK